MTRKLLFCVALMAAASQTGLSQGASQANAWNGTWKMNPAKSHLSGTTLTLTAMPDGKMKYSNGSTYEYVYACDGQPYPTLADRMITCIGSGSRLAYTLKAGGNVLGTWTDTLAADSKTYSSKGTSMHADGTSSTYEEKYTRVGAGSGFAGTWKNISAKTTNADLMQVSVAGDTMHVAYPANKEVYEAKLDGTPTEVKGPTIPAGAMMTVKLDNPTKTTFAGMYQGKTLFQGTQTVSPDGKTLIEEEWDPGKESEKETVLYEKQ